MFARDRSRIREKQNQLCECGAANMIINVLSCNSKSIIVLSDKTLLCSATAEQSPAVEATLKLGVSLLKGGNDEVQKVCKN